MSDTAGPSGPTADWYEDPMHRHQYRYWDGANWTDHVADAGQTATDPIAPPAPVDTRPEAAAPAEGVSVEDFARRAAESRASMQTSLNRTKNLVDALTGEVASRYGIESGEAFSYVTNDLVIACPNCGPFSPEAVSYLYLAGSERGAGMVLGGPNVAAMTSGRCPGCGGTEVTVTFDPAPIQVQIETARARMAAARNLSAPRTAAAPVPFLSSIAVSPDEETVCAVEPGGGVIARKAGTDSELWTLAGPSVEPSLCRFVGPQRLLVLSEPEKDSYLLRLVNTADGSMLAETAVPSAYLDRATASPTAGLFAAKSSYDSLLVVRTTDDTIETTKVSCGQVYAGPRIGPDDELYVIVAYALYRLDGTQKTELMHADNCICFDAVARRIYCGGGYSDRSGASSIGVYDMASGQASQIDWGVEPVDELELAGEGRILVGTTVNEVQMARYPNASVTLVRTDTQAKEWSLTIDDAKPWRPVLLASAPEAGWVLVQTGAVLKFVSLEDGSTIKALPKERDEFVSACWLPGKQLVYLGRNPDRGQPGTLECYDMAGEG